MNKLRARIDLSLESVKATILHSFISNEDDDKNVFYAFPEHTGKTRITEWGGTSSVLQTLNRLSPTYSNENNVKIESAIDWLKRQQHSDGAWDCAELYCSEATSAILFDLKDISKLSENEINNALEYIRRCFSKDGFFTSTPRVEQNPHIYTTYLAVRTLYSYNKLTNINKDKIKNWIEKSKYIGGNSSCSLWGQIPNSAEFSIPHTIFALFILYYCGESKTEIVKKYLSTIKFLRNEMYKNKDKMIFDYEEVERNVVRDRCGYLPKILMTYHCRLTLLTNFFLFLNEAPLFFIGINSLLKTMQNGGWGVRKNEVSFWCTQQAVNCLCEFRDNYLGKYNSIQIIYYSYSFFSKGILTILLLFLISSVFLLIGKFTPINAFLTLIVSTTLSTLLGKLLDEISLNK